MTQISIDINSAVILIDAIEAIDCCSCPACTDFGDDERAKNGNMARIQAIFGEIKGVNCPRCGKANRIGWKCTPSGLRPICLECEAVILPEAFDGVVDRLDDHSRAQLFALKRRFYIVDKYMAFQKSVAEIRSVPMEQRMAEAAERDKQRRAARQQRQDEAMRKRKERESRRNARAHRCRR